VNDGGWHWASSSFRRLHTRELSEYSERYLESCSVRIIIRIIRLLGLYHAIVTDSSNDKRSCVQTEVIVMITIQSDLHRKPAWHAIGIMVLVIHCFSLSLKQFFEDLFIASLTMAFVSLLDILWIWTLAISSPRLVQVIFLGIFRVSDSVDWTFEVSLFVAFVVHLRIVLSTGSLHMCFSTEWPCVNDCHCTVLGMQRCEKCSRKCFRRWRNNVKTKKDYSGIIVVLLLFSNNSNNNWFI